MSILRKIFFRERVLIVLVLALGLKQDRLKKLRDKWVLCPICGVSSGSFQIKGLFDDSVVCESCGSRWVLQFSSRREDEPWMVKLKERRGKRVEGSWIAVEGWITRKMREYESYQASKGLARDDGEWISFEEKERREFERERLAKSLAEERFKLVQETEREEREKLKGPVKHMFEWIECPRCTKRYSSKWPECPYCLGREIREAQDRGRLH